MPGEIVASLCRVEIFTFTPGRGAEERPVPALFIK
jgi:hypothetical protein